MDSKEERVHLRACVAGHFEIRWLLPYFQILELANLQNQFR